MKPPSAERAPAARCPENIDCRLEGVGKTYSVGGQEVKALSDISLEIESGGFWAIMGTSGAGKSSLLNLLGCLDRPTTGTYYLCGRDVMELDDDGLSELRLRKLGFIFQSFHLIPELTVRENVELPLFYLNRDSRRNRERAEELAGLVGLADRLQHRPMELSGGQQQRVAVARALANDPAILLADEPTGNLDSATSKRIMGLLAELNGRGKTIIMVTHEAEVAAYADRNIFMRDGRIESVS